MSLSIFEGMLGYLTDKMHNALRHLKGLNKLSEANIQEALKEVRSALLGADVHFKVVKDFIEKVSQACIGAEVLKSVSPSQQAIKIIHDELVRLLGGEEEALTTPKTPFNLLMVGLHGAGKTSSSAKLARFFTKQGLKPLLIACDVYRPAAIDQLAYLAKQENVACYLEKGHNDVLRIARNALTYAEEIGAQVLIFDTAGRLQIDEKLIQELKDLSKLIQPQETLLVADSALGQEAVNIAQQFHEAVGLTSILLTKLDGDAKGGAALSMKAMTGVPIKFVATGEKVGDFSRFHPERMAQRILGMGDIVSLVEQAQENLDENEMTRLQKRLEKGEMDLNDMLSQIRQLKKLGSMKTLAKMLPGMHKLEVGDKEQDKIKYQEAILSSMTPQERAKPKILNGSRRLRIAKGSGREVREVNQLVKQFEDMQKFLKSAKKGGGFKKIMEKMQSSPQGTGGFPFGM